MSASGRWAGRWATWRRRNGWTRTTRRTRTGRSGSRGRGVVVGGSGGGRPRRGGGRARGPNDSAWRRFRWRRLSRCPLPCRLRRACRARRSSSLQ
uniref:Uncharacterized protein n=1 Tax=Arundo donax TaxID=35708 RepID=A0A0A8Z7L9_ARUDO